MKFVAKYGGASGKKLLDIGTRIGADATYAAFLTNTVGAPRMILDSLKEMEGTIQASPDLFGNIQVNDVTDRVSAQDAFLRSETRNWIENFSEMMGGWGAGKLLWGGAKKLPTVGKFLRGIELGIDRQLNKDLLNTAKQYLQTGLIENNAILTKKGLGKVIPTIDKVFNKRVLQAGQFNGFFGEVAEEYYGLILQHLLGVQDDPNASLWEDVKKQSFDIWGGIAASSGLLGAFGMAGSIRSQLKYNNAVSNLVQAFGEENALEIQKMLTFAHPADLINKYTILANKYGGHEGRTESQKFKDKLQNIGKALRGEEMTPLEKKVALADYLNSLIELRGAVYGEEFINKAMGVQQRELQYAARDAGYSTPSYATLQTMTTVEKMLENDTNQLLPQQNAAEIYEQHGGNIRSIIDDILNGKISHTGSVTNEQLAESFVAYHNSKTYKEGVDESLADLAKDRINKRKRLARMLAHKGGNTYKLLTRKNEKGNDERLFWIDGELKTQIGSDEVESQQNMYPKDNGKILVSDSSGQYKYVDRSELKGWHIDSTEYSVVALERALERDENKEESARREKYLKKFGVDTAFTGSAIRVGDKRITILDNKGANGITYSVSDENGDNAEIYYAENVETLNQLTEQINEGKNRKITDLFKQKASQIVKDYISYDRERALENYKKQREEYYKRQEELDWSDSDREEENDNEEITSQDDSKQSDNKPSIDLSVSPEYLIPENFENPTEEDLAILDQAKTAEAAEGVTVAALERDANAVENARIEEQKAAELAQQQAAEEAKRIAEEHAAELARQQAEIEERERLAKQAAAAAVRAINEPSQEAAYNDLVESIKNAEKQKKGVSGFHYFMEINGKLRLARRVHSIQRGVYIHKERDEKIEEIKARLKASDSLFEEVEKILTELKEKDLKDYRSDKKAELLDKQRRESLQIDLYRKYLEQNQEDIDEVIDAFSHVLTNKTSESVVAGSVYDVICRHFLDGTRTTPLKYDDPRLTIYFYGEEVHISQFIDEDTFNKICNDETGLGRVKKYYEETLGWKLCTTPYTLCAELLVNGKKFLVSGETDCIAVDKEGKLHLIDFKTYSTYSKLYHDTEHETSNLYDIDAEKQTDNVAVEYAEQLAIYKLLLRASGKQIQSNELLFFGIAYAKKDNFSIQIKETAGKAKTYITIKENGENVPNRVNVDKQQDEQEFRHVNQLLDYVEKEIKILSNTQAGITRQLIESLEILDKIEDLPEGLQKRINEFNQKIKDASDNTKDEDLDSVLSNLRDEKSEIEKKVSDYYEDTKQQKETVEKIKKSVSKYYPNLNDINGLFEGQMDVVFSAYISIVNNDGKTLNKNASQEDIETLISELTNLLLLLKYVENERITGFNKIDESSRFAKGILRNLIDSGLTNVFDIINNNVRNGEFQFGSIDEEETRVSEEYTGLEDKAKGRQGYEIDNVKSSHAVNDENKKLSDVMNDPYFINNAEFYIVNNPTQNLPHNFQMIVVFNGVEYTPVTIKFAYDPETKERLKDADDLREKLKSLTANGNRVRVNNNAISRTFGKFLDEDEQLPPLHDVNTLDLLGVPLNEIRYSSNTLDPQNNIGIIRAVDTSRGKGLAVTVPNPNGKGYIPIYQYSGKNKTTRLSAGGVVLLYKVNHKEKGEEKTPENTVPINLESVNFDEETANVVADILDGIRKGDFKLDDYYANTPFKNEEVINCFISYGFASQKQNKSKVNVSVIGDKIVLSGRIKGINTDSSGDSVFSIKEFTDKNEFVKFLVENVRMQISEDFMSAKLSFKERKDIQEWFDTHTEDEIKFGNSPISFKRSDFEQGLSGIAWYIRTKMLQTRFNGLKRPLISFDEKTLLDNSSYEQTLPDNNSVVENQPLEANAAIDPDGASVLDVFNNMKAEKASKNQQQQEDSNAPIRPLFSTCSIQDADGTINEEEAKQRIRDIVGDIKIPSFEETVLKNLTVGVVVGQCYENMIRLSKRAKRGTEYHEAFHRVLELLVDTDTREKAYKSYRKRFGQNLTDLQVAERAADEFWWFMENKPKYKFSDGLLKLFTFLKAWYKFYTKIGSYNLYRLYNSAACGKYKNVKPTNEAIQRWRKLTAENGGYLASTYQLNGRSYKHIMNNEQYEATLETIRYIVLQPDTYSKSGTGQVLDPTGKHLGSIHPTKEMLVNSPALLEIMTSVNIPAEGKMRLSEVMGLGVSNGKIVLIDNRLDSILDDILKGLNQFEVNGSISTVSQKRNETEEDKTRTGEDDEEWSLTEQRQYGEYQKVSAEFDPITRATPRVKFFFARFVDSIPVYYLDPKTDEPRVSFTVKLNAAGLPQLTPYKNAWGKVLNLVHECRGQLELRDKLRVLSQIDSRFEQIYKDYDNLLKQAYEKDPDTGTYLTKQGRLTGIVKDDDAYGLAKEIVSTICLSKNIPNVAQSMQSGTDSVLQGSIRVYEASMEYQVKDIRKSWSNAFVSGRLEFIERLENGKIKVKNVTALDKLENDLRGLVDLFVPTSVRGKTNYLSGLTISKKFRKLSDDGELLDSSNFEIKEWKGRDIDLTDPACVYAIKEKFVECLNRIGINITIDDLDFALRERSGRTDRDALRTFFLENGTGILNIANKLDFVKNYTKNDLYDQVKDIWSNKNNQYNVAIDTLSVAKYRKRSDEEQLSYLTIAGKNQYSMGEHNAITDKLDEIKKEESEILANLLDDPFYKSSRALQYVADKENRPTIDQMHFIPLPGLKTDAHGSEGVEYTEMSEQEDVVVKYSLLTDNQLILETLSDKTTWGSIKMPYGFNAFGIDWVTDKDDFKATQRLETNEKNVLQLLRGGKYQISYNKKGDLIFEFTDDVLDQFIDYAYSEYNSAKQELKRYETLSEEEKIVNFHHGNKQKSSIIQGARLSTFTGIIKDDGTFVSFNNLHKTEAQCLEDAEREFFGLVKENPDKTASVKLIRDKEKQRHLMQNVLSYQLQKELDWLKSLNLISIENGLFKNNENGGLDKVKIRKVEQWLQLSDLYSKHGVIPDSDTRKKDKTSLPERASSEIHHRAIVMYVADMVIKSQFSHQEFLRLFSGNLAYYAWKYDETSGNVLDTTTDFFKRMGGLASTGVHNTIDDFEDTDYVCAEIKDEKIVSPLLNDFQKNAKEQELRKLLKSYLKQVYKVDGKLKPITFENSNQEWAKQAQNEINTLVSSYDLQKVKQEIIKLYKEQQIEKLGNEGIAITESLTKSIEQDAENLIDSVELDIDNRTSALAKVNSTDGATYISDEFCEKLLRSIGKWDSKIAKAFAILRNTTSITNQNMRSVADAYNAIYQQVIGTQKYTAFGFRPIRVSIDTDEGRKLEYTQNEVYYDKTAFFPIFSCMATGHMKAVLAKMHEQEIDVLKMSSATKEGGKGAVTCDESTFEKWNENPESYKDFKFNTYTQRLQDLRKQFNTDPKEKEYMTLGSQYQKVVMLLLHSDQVYDVNGEKLDAHEIREQVMDCYNAITRARKDEHDNVFYNTDGSLNDASFIRRLNRQIEDRESNDQLRKYLSLEYYYEPDPNNPDKKIKKSKIKLPVAALGSTKWIQSIITSIINKDIIDVNTPGQAFYQRSAWAMEGQMSQELGNIISQDDWKHQINHGAKLKAKNEKGSMDVVLSIDFFNYLFEKHPGLKNQSFTTKKAWLIKNGIISGFEAHEHEYVIKEGDVYLDPDTQDVVEIKEGDERIGKTMTVRMWKNADTSIIGYRIPTQAPSSIHAMRCVDVIEAVRDTIIMAKEVTAITGSDYDIDKFFLSTFFYNEQLDSETKDEVSKVLNEFGISSEEEAYAKYKKAQQEYDVAKDTNDPSVNEKEQAVKKLAFLLSKIGEIQRKGIRLSKQFDKKENPKKYYCNKLLDLQISMLITNDNNLVQLQGSIDADTIPLKEIANKIRSKDGTNPLMPFDSMSLMNAVKAKMAFAKGKKGIGPYALNNNNHVFTMLYGVKFKDDKGILSDLGLLDLSKGIDKNGHSISSWISGLVNAHVDVAKDPYIGVLGVNPYTYNLVSLLIRTGFGKDTFWFTTQPIMQQMYDIYDQAVGVYNQNEDVSKYTRVKNEIDNFYVNFFNSIIGTDKVFDVANGIEMYDDYFKSKYNGIAIRTAIKALMTHPDGLKTLEKISTSKEDTLYDQSFDIGLSEKIEYSDIQALVAISNYKLQEKAQYLSNLVQYTKIDTKKQGKTIAEQIAYNAKMEELLDPEKSPFEHEAINRMINGSFIGPKTRDAISAERRLLRTQLIEATDKFQDMLDIVKNYLNSKRMDEPFITSISEAIVAKLKSDYFFRGVNAYCVKRGINPKSVMTSPTESIHAQLVAIHEGLLDKENHKYDSIRDENGNCNNYLLNNLIPHFKATPGLLYGTTEHDINDSWQNALFIKNQNIFDDFIKSAKMQNAWEDLLNDTEHPELQRFAEELIVYAFITSASNGGKYDLFKYVPYSWMTGECEFLKYSNVTTFSDYIQKTINKFNGKDLVIFSDEELDEMILNFSYDDNIVKTVSSHKVDQMESILNNNFYPTPVIIGGLNNNSPVFIEDEWPAFFKIRNSQYKSGQLVYTVYKLIAVGERRYERDGKEHSFKYPIYALIQRRGGTYNEGQRIYDMGIQYNKSSKQKKQEEKYWKSAVPQLIKKVKESVDDFITPEQMFQETVYLANQKVSGLFNNISIGESPLKSMIEDVLNNGSSRIEGASFLLKEYTDDSRSNEQKSNFIQESTVLRLQNKDKRYKKSSLSEIKELGAFGPDIEKAIDYLEGIGLHIEYYKKESRDGSHWDPTITVSFNYGSAFGFFEICADIDLDEKQKTGEIKYTNSYSVHFKTYNKAMKENIDFAQVPLNDSQKQTLIQAILTILPMGATLSTYGKLSKGGFHMLQELDKYTSPVTGLIQNVETREVENGSVPVWKKIKNSNFDPIVESTKSKFTKEDADYIKTVITNEVGEQLRESIINVEGPNKLEKIIKNCIDTNKRLKQTVINSGNKELALFDDSEINTALRNVRTLLQNGSSAESVDENCSI